MKEKDTLDKFEYLAKNAYVASLRDLLFGMPISDLESLQKHFEQEGDYEECEGIKRALMFSKEKTLIEIEKELLSLTKI